jgi:hypothetical protein
MISRAESCVAYLSALWEVSDRRRRLVARTCGCLEGVN